MPFLELIQVSKHFGGVKAVDRFSLNVEKGELFGIIGPNGAGKSTLFNLISGFDRPTSGDIRLDGNSITRLRPHQIAMAGIGRTFQTVHLFQGLTVLETLTTALYGNTGYTLLESFLRTKRYFESEKWARERAVELLQLVGLQDWSEHKADALPYGLQRKLELAKALAISPKTLLLDEPAAGLNTEESLELSRLIYRIWKELDITVLLIEHHMEVVMSICRKIAVINFGQKLAEGTPEEVQSNPLVLEAYLGREDEETA